MVRSEGQQSLCSVGEMKCVKQVEREKTWGKGLLEEGLKGVM